MKTVFDAATRESLIKRIEKLDTNCVAVWGRMNAAQMIRHCTLWEEMIHGNKRYPRVFIGRLLGRTMLRKEMKNDNHMRKNNPTIPALKVLDKAIDFETEKQKWISFIRQYAAYDIPDNSFIHPFFGQMTKAEIGCHAYKHNDHHLRQFSC